MLHLIVAVVPDAGRCLREVARVLRPGGRALVLSTSSCGAASRVVTRTDVVFEQALEAAPELVVRDDRGGWFRLIELERT